MTTAHDPEREQTPTDETDTIPNPETGVGIGASDKPDTFEPEEPE